MRYAISVVFLPLRRTRRRSRAMVWTPGKPTCCGLASWQSITRISCRPRLFSRVMAWVRGVGGGGKTLFGEQRRERFKEALLILFDRQQVIAALLVKNLLGRLHLRMRRIRQHDFTHDVQIGQLLACGRDFIAAFLDFGGTQPAARATDGVD